MFFISLEKRLKCLLMDFPCIFWTFVFPFMLAVFFITTIPSSSYQNFSAIPVAIVGEKDSDNMLFFSMSAARTSTGKALFQVVPCSSVVAEEKLNSKDIVAYIDTEQDDTVYTNTYGTESVIVKTFVNWFHQTDGMEVLNFEMQYSMEECAQESYNRNAVYYLILLGMSAFLAIYWGLRIATDMEENLSGVAARIAIAPKPRIYMVLQNMIAVSIVELVVNCLIVTLFELSGKLQLADMRPQVLLVAMLTSIEGIVIGIVLGVLVRSSYASKMKLCGIVTFIGGFLAGIMFYKVRFIVVRKIPVLGFLNPIHIASDALFHLYLIPEPRMYWTDVSVLSIQLLIFFVIAIIITRRKAYAHI